MKYSSISKKIFEMEMNNEIFKQTKYKYGKNINGSPSFIRKFLIQNQIIHNYSEVRKLTVVVINNFSSIQNKRK